MSQFTPNKIRGSKYKHKTIKRYESKPFKRTKRVQHSGAVLTKITPSNIKTKFTLLREVSIKIIITLNRLNKYLSLDTDKKNKSFANKLLGKRVKIKQYYTPTNKKEYLKLSYALSGSRTSK